jgi:hypothetical protein
MDRQDLNMLIQLHLREKQELHEANKALRDALQRHGISDRQLKAQVEDINNTVDQIMREQNGVSSVLLLSAQDEIVILKNKVRDMESEVDLMKKMKETAPPVTVRGGGGGGGGKSFESPTRQQQEGEEETRGPTSVNQSDTHNESEELIANLRSALATKEQELVLVKETADRNLLQTKEHYMATQKSQQELLVVAQDGRLAAESRYEAAEKRVAEAEAIRRDAAAETSSLKEQLIRIKVDKDSIQKQLMLAKTQLNNTEKNKRFESAMSEMHSQISKLKYDLDIAHQEQANYKAKVHSLQQQLVGAESAEVAIAERDALAAQLQAMEARLQDVRREEIDAASIQTLLRQSEDRRAQAEQELVTTAKLASSLESKLAAASAEIDALRGRVEETEMRVERAQQSVITEVQRQWACAGRERSAWPLPAQEEVENIEARLSAVNSTLVTLQQQIEEEGHARKLEQQQRIAAEQRALVVEETAQRRMRDALLKEQKAQTSAAAASQQVRELRMVVSSLEKERDEARVKARGNDYSGSNTLPVSSISTTTTATGGGGKRGSGGLEDLNGNNVGTTSTSTINAPATIPLPRKVGGKNDALSATDLVYMKNVMLRFLVAYAGGKTQEWEALLPAVAALLRASPQEYAKLRDSLHQPTTALGWLYSLTSK